MAGMRFEWDRAKNSVNKRKHGESFEEAETVFSDEHALLINDQEHSDEEKRFILLGLKCGASETNTIEGGENEKALRFFKSEAEPVCEALKKGSDPPTRRTHGRVFRR